MQRIRSSMNRAAWGAIIVALAVAFSTMLAVRAAPVVTLTDPGHGAVIAHRTPTFRGVAGTERRQSETVTVRVFAGSTTSGTPLQQLTAARDEDSGAYAVTASASLADGLYTARAEQREGGNELHLSSSNTFRVKATPPAVSLAQPAAGGLLATGSPSFGGTAGTAVGDLDTVAIRIYSGSGTSGALVRTLTTTRQPSSGAFSASLPEPLADGTYTARAQQSDSAGNTGFSSANTFRVDTTAPSVSLTAPAEGAWVDSPRPELRGAGGTAVGDRSTVEIEIYAGDAPTGAPLQSLTTTRDISTGAFAATPSGALADGTYTARAAQSDTADNEGASPAVSFGVDTTAPTSSATAPRFSNSASVTVSYTVSEARSGVRRIELWAKAPGGAGFDKVDTLNSPTSTGSFVYTAASEGDHEFFTIAVDRAGNSEIKLAADAITTVDTIAPTTSDDSDGDWHATAVQVSLAASDPEPGSGVESTYYRLDGGPWVDGTTVTVGAPTTHSNDGVHTIDYYSVDRAGNSEAPKSTTVRIDTTDPSSSIKCNGSPCSSAPYDSSVTVALSALDPGGSGVDVIRYTTDGTTPTRINGSTYSGSFSVEQTTSVNFRSYDLAGNIEATKTTLIEIATPEPPTRPNILLIVTDDQREDTLEVMPKLREWFGSGGTHYTEAYATTPLCCPSRSSIYSGRYAHNHGVRLNPDGTKLENNPTIQRYLHAAGYNTAITGKFLNAWDVATAPPHFDKWAVFNPSKTTGNGYVDNKFNVNGAVTTISQYSTDYIGDKAGEFLTGFESDDTKPWMLVMTPYAPHKPYLPEADYATSPVGTWAGNPAVGEADRTDKPAYVQAQSSTLSAARAIRRQQLRSLMSVDDMVGQVAQTLQSLGEEQETLAVFMSDNGIMWGEHGITGKRVPYTASVKLPFLMRWPGHVGSGVIDERIVANIDVAPTVLEAAGVTPEASMDGRSLLGPGARERILLEHWGQPNEPPTWASIRTTTYQYIEDYAKDGRVTFREYYDLVADPFQLRNLLADGDPANDPGNVGALSAQLARDRTCTAAACP